MEAARFAEALARHDRAVLVTVIRAEGSAPRGAGARMLVTAAGISGSVGGGALEWRAINDARAMLGEAMPKPRRLSLALGPDLGQCCGGRVTLEARLVTEADVADLDRESGPAPRPLLLFGAGHVGRALVLILAGQPFAVRWIDSRADAFPAALPRTVAAVRVEAPEREAAAAPPGSFVLVMTHSHAEDFAIVDAALRNPAVAWTGLIGSATKRARFETRLRQAGVAPLRIAGLACPIGLAQIRSKEPAAIALSTAAELLALDEALARAEEIPMPPLRMSTA